MGGKGGTKIEQPDPIDPGKATGEYLFGSGFSSYEGVTDPRLQEKLIAAEAAYRPQYTALELGDIATMAYGIDDPKQDPQYRKLQAELAGLKAGKGGVSDEEAMRIARASAGPAPSKTKQVKRNIGRSKRTVEVRNKNYAAEKKTYDAEVNKIAESLSGNREARIAQIETQMAGLEKAGGTPGLFTMLEDQSRRAGELQREQLGLQRADDVSALREFAPQVVEAYREADPRSAALADLAQQQAETLYAEAEGPLSPERRRMAEQAARQGSLARGRIGDESSIAAEILGREQFKSGLRAEARQAGAGAFGQQRQMAGDVGMTILGRPSAAIGLGGQMLGQAQAGAAGPMGPQLFDPNVGINMAMQQRSQDINLMGAQAQANAAQGAGLMGGLGAIGGGLLGNPSLFSCWVAREVYGVDNPKWLQFREWMLEDSPSWFRSLYIKYGERFAKFISNKPLLKTIIRKWMNTRIK
jgi:hypothetical protein